MQKQLYYRDKRWLTADQLREYIELREEANDFINIREARFINGNKKVEEADDLDVLKELYVRKFAGPVPLKFRNNKNWIKSKI